MPSGQNSFDSREVFTNGINVKSPESYNLNELARNLHSNTDKVTGDVRRCPFSEYFYTNDSDFFHF